MASVKQVALGNLKMGGGAPITIQSMTTTKTADIERTVAQIADLKKAGCEIVRVAVADDEDAAAVKEVVNRISLPLVADIHFSPSLAVKAIENGASKVRINPGNIGGMSRVQEVVHAVLGQIGAQMVGPSTVGVVGLKVGESVHIGEEHLTRRALYGASGAETSRDAVTHNKNRAYLPGGKRTRKCRGGRCG